MSDSVIHMNEDDRNALASAYVSHYSTPHVWDKDMVLTERDNSDTRWASNKVMNLSYENPEELWEFILEVLRRDPPVEVIQILAAGPLEDYIAKLGNKVIERVEHQAAIDPKFKSLLGGVWRNSMCDEIWQRVQACWDRSSWD